jgi:hypothetical protein
VHEAGVIHRDLKPSNVLLAQDGPRLIDFGISHAADFSHVTLVGSVIGTPGFMSPEQALGDPVGPPSDIFSLGAVLAFAATGEGPYGTGSPAARQMRVLAIAPRLDNLPAELRPLVEQCMAREPAERPTASQFLTDLVAAYPEAADQTDWLPAGILTGVAVPPLRSAPTKADPLPLPVAAEAVPVAAEAVPVAAEAVPAPVTPVPAEETSTPSEPVMPVPPPGPATRVPASASPTPEPKLAWESTLTATARPPAERGSVAAIEVVSPRPQSPAEPPEPRNGKERRSPRRRRRLWVIVAAVVAAVAGTVIGLVTAAPGIPPVLAPTGLVTSDRMPQSVQIAWSGPESGPLPDQYEVLQNGQEVASVAGTKTDYDDTGLSPGTTYYFSVIAIRGTMHSPSSGTLTATTTNPPPLQPTGLATSDRTTSSVELVWSGPATGPVPDQYEILQDGTEAGSVQGSTTDYLDAGLDPGTSYQFSVVAIRDGKQSPPSRTITVKTTTPPLSDAVLHWSGPVDATETVGTFTQSVKSNPDVRNPGDTWQESWSFTPNCVSGPCGVEFYGSVTGGQFTVQLSRNGSTYSGSVPVNDWWVCTNNTSHHINSTLDITVKGVHAGVKGGVWSITSFTGTVTWNVDSDPLGACTGSTYEMQVHSA